MSHPESLQWQTLDKKVPRLGSNRNNAIAKIDKDLGELNWRFAWDLGDENFGGFDDAISLYENSYYKHLQEAKCPHNPNLKKTDYLSQEAADVFDTTPRNTESGFNYYHQSTPAAHFQDISIRRVMAKLGMRFNGDKLIKVRSRYNPDSVGISLSPKKIDFIKPEIVKLPATKRDRTASIEDFWQYNRVLQFCDGLAKLPLAEKAQYVKEPFYPDPISNS
jgi:hypothetical protein